MQEKNQIKFALYLDGWKYDGGDKKLLREKAQEVIPTEYDLEMKENIFCPECCADMFRSPQEKDYDTNGRKAFYAHSRKYSPDCGLRVKRAEGKRFETEEQAKEAIENEELVIISGFMKSKPKGPIIDEPQEYQGKPVEDINGVLTEVPIGRHNGEIFKLPSKVTTIRGICRNFNKNIHRYFYFPDKKNAIHLQDLLINIESLKNTDDVAKLYFGRINSSWNCGKTSQNIRQTMVNFIRNDDYVDFCLKTTDQNSKEHGIGDDSKGKIILIYGKVTVSGIGLCIENVGWGEFSVLPEKYEYLLY